MAPKWAGKPCGGSHSFAAVGPGLRRREVLKMRSNPWQRALAGALVASSVLAVGCAMKERSEPAALSAPQSHARVAQAEPRTEAVAVGEDSDEEGEVAAGQIGAMQPTSDAPAEAPPPPAASVGATTAGVSRSGAYVPPAPGGGGATGMVTMRAKIDSPG